MDKVIDESFLKSDVTEFALGYDRVKNHTWYDNLNYLVDLSKEYFNDDDFIMDYSCGTGIFPERLLKSTVSCPRILMMDSSPKYLKLSYDKFGNNYKFFFRLMKYLKEENRLQTIDESMGKDYKDSYGKKLILKLKKIDHITLIGMGGSILGAKSIYKFLKPKLKKFTFIDNFSNSVTSFSQ